MKLSLIMKNFETKSINSEKRKTILIRFIQISIRKLKAKKEKFKKLLNKQESITKRETMLKES